MLNFSLKIKLWRRNSTLFAVILNVFLSRNLDQSVLQNKYFLGKTVSASGAPPPDPHVLTPVYDYNFVEYVSSAKCIFSAQKKTK